MSIKKNVDCRVFSFSKWILPKTKSYCDMNESSITVGYFDFITVKETENALKNPLEKYVEYKNNKINSYLTDSDKYKNNIKDDFDITSQQLFAFTNVSSKENLQEGIYSCEKVNDFWKNNSLIRFYTLVHIENGAKKENVLKIISSINDYFSSNTKDEKYNALCYFSLDYSDIIICAKNLSASEFINNIFSLNYNSRDHLIRDSFSLISIDSSIIKKINNIHLKNGECYKQYADLRSEIFDLIKKNGFSTHGIEEPITVSFNIGVQNFNTMNDLEIALNKINIDYNKYRLLGRHDVAIYNEKADLLWLLIIQIYIDYFTKNDSKYNADTVLFNCESFIRIPFDLESVYVDSSSQNYENQIYKNAKKELSERINEYIDNAKKCNCVKTAHIMPLCALKNSILGLLKNGFADDFVLCLYKSFTFFISYMGQKLLKDHLHDNNFDLTFNSYFDNINSLINSAMHSDRQFIQSPSFDPVFYDVPPKLMAYYTAMTDLIYNIIYTVKDQERDCNYSFMFRPSFQSSIKVVRYSYNELAPTDRLLAVTINENDLYFPRSVFGQICHEVAHFVGDGNRNRKIREESFLKCILYDILYDFLKFKVKAIDDNILMKWVHDVFYEIEQTSFYRDNLLYTDDLENLVYQSIIFIYDNNKIKMINEDMFMKLPNISESRLNLLLSEFKSYIFLKRISLIDSNSVNNFPENNTIDILITVFSELYADLQMILILDMSMDEYLSTFQFIIKNDRDIIFNDKLYYRILNIAILRILNGDWTIELKDKNNTLKEQLFVDVNSFLKFFDSSDITKDLKEIYHNSDPIKTIESLDKYSDSNWNRYHFWNLYIQKYITAVYESSLECYYENEDKKMMINKLKNNLKIVQGFEDAVDVFCNIQNENEIYARKIYGLDPDMKNSN